MSDEALRNGAHALHYGLLLVVALGVLGAVARDMVRRGLRSVRVRREHGDPGPRTLAWEDD